MTSDWEQGRGFSSADRERMPEGLRPSEGQRPPEGMIYGGGGGDGSKSYSGRGVEPMHPGWWVFGAVSLAALAVYFFSGNAQQTNHARQVPRHISEAERSSAEKILFEKHGVKLQYRTVGDLVCSSPYTLQCSGPWIGPSVLDPKKTDARIKLYGPPVFFKPSGSRESSKSYQKIEVIYVASPDTVSWGVHAEDHYRAVVQPLGRWGVLLKRSDFKDGTREALDKILTIHGFTEPMIRACERHNSVAVPEAVKRLSLGTVNGREYDCGNFPGGPNRPSGWMSFFVTEKRFVP
jgi:hypothetical protein